MPGYDEIRRAFAWRIPERFNIGVACCAHPRDAVAVVDGDRELTFGQLDERSNRLANALQVERGERVGFVLPQGADAAVMHCGIYKAGAVALPLSELFGEDALRHRLADSGTRVVVASPASLEVVREIAADLGIRAIAAGEELERLLADASPRFEPVETAADDPAYIVYTSGTTAAPKGALHAHRNLLGQLPGFCYAQGRFPVEGDRFWTPADWSWMGGLMDAFVPTLFFGRSIVASPRGRFDPELAARLIVERGIRNTFLPPTALRLMKNAGVSVPPGTLRAVISGGEVLGGDVLDWAEECLGVTVAEFYGQTELNLVIGNSPAWPVKRGSMGRPYPGHEVALDDGEIVIRVPDPVAFLGYWNAPEATAEKVVDGWLRTGDLARVDEDGYFWFTSRADDLISSAGYRISPLEIEACLVAHPGVAQAAVIGIPDAVRGQAIKAFVVARPGAAPTTQELQDFVRARLAAYEYPRAVEFVDELPLTVTGKIRRRALHERG